MIADVVLSRTAGELAQLNYRVEEIYDKKYGKIFHLPEQHIVICELTQPYVPIEKFRKIFEKVGNVIRETGAKKFIFDKRHLKAFHQPSMEWYFVEWKEDMYKAGMTVHRKILPPEEWFEQAVKAGKAQILKKYPDTVIDLLDIQYRNTVREAIES